MANYFIKDTDYDVVIESTELAVITTTPIRRQAELRAIETAKGYMRQHYLVDVVFAPFLPFLTSASYQFGDRITLDALPFNSASTYSVGVTVKEGSKVYEANQIVSPGAFNPTQWDLIGDEGDYYADAAVWAAIKAYNIGDTVKFEDRFERRFFKCLVANTGRDPRDNSNDALWDPVTNFQENPTNTNYWILGDNRNPSLLAKVIDLALFDCYHRVQPRNVPEMRIIAKEDAMAWLSKVQGGHITLDLPLVPESGGQAGFNISWTSRTPYTNNYY